VSGSRARKTDDAFMRRAVELAEKGLGETNPNPMVGCVIVKGGRVVGEGFHSRAGLAHAEPMALASAGSRARGATAYVTLEPCAPNPAKRTPPCAPRLIDAGIARVVVGARDANPFVHGRGLAALRKAGIKVDEDVLYEDCARLTRHFNFACARRRPWVCLKAGMTLDGRIATASGASKWITSPKQRGAARSLRRLFDGVLVGIGTASADDPRLLPAPPVRRPFARIVLDPRLRLSAESRLAASADRNALLVVCAQGANGNRSALENKGAMIVEIPSAVDGRLDPVLIVDALFGLGLHSVLVEGGSETHGSFVRAGLFDEVVLFRAPVLLGGRGSRSVVGGDDPTTLSEGRRLKPARPETSATLHYGLEDGVGLDVEVYEPAPARRSNRAEH